jgi:hypothetical protein
MNIEDVINKLEFILHKKSIKTLEKYTQQVAATAATTTTPPVTTTPPTTTPPTTTPPTTTPPVTTPPVTTPTTPPKEEDKKPSEEATKFENNLMDTLKWVFIGIAIFVVIILILGIVYWFIFGSSTSTTETTDGMNAENMNAENMNAENMNGENMNGENAANAEVPYNDIQEPYIEASPINDASSSSMLSSFIPYSSSFSRNESPEVLAVAVQEPVIEAPDIQVLPTAISATTPEIPTAISATTPEIPAAISASSPEIPTSISASSPEIPAAPSAIAAVPEPVIVPEPISASSIAVQNNSIEVKK